MSDVPKFLKQMFPANEDGNTLSIFGQTKCGKTHLIRYLMRVVNIGKVPGVIFCNSLTNKAYKSSEFDHLAKFDFYDPRVIDEMATINRKTDNAYDFLVLIDDENGVTFDQNVMKLFLNLRNLCISTILSTQNYTLLAKKNRGQSNYQFFGHYDNDEDIIPLVQKYLTRFISGKSLQDKVESYRGLTSDHGFIWINHITEKCGIFTAPP